MSELINRAKRYIDLWDNTSCVEIEILNGMVDARDAYYAAPDLVRELVAKIQEQDDQLDAIHDVADNYRLIEDTQILEILRPSEQPTT